MKEYSKELEHIAAGLTELDIQCSVVQVQGYLKVCSEGSAIQNYEFWIGTPSELVFYDEGNVGIIKTESDILSIVDSVFKTIRCLTENKSYPLRGEGARRLLSSIMSGASTRMCELSMIHTPSKVYYDSVREEDGESDSPTLEPSVFQLPQQSMYLGNEVSVYFNGDTSNLIGGTIVRDDIELPFVTIIQLDSGVLVLASECQYTMV